MGRKKNSDKLKEKNEENITLLVDEKKSEELLPESPKQEVLNEINLHSEPVVSEPEPVVSEPEPGVSKPEPVVEPFIQPKTVVEEKPLLQPSKKQINRRGATMPMFLGRR